LLVSSLAIDRLYVLADISIIPNSGQSHGGIPDDKENNVPCDNESNWLHRNDAYQVQQISGRKRVVAMPHVSANMQTMSSSIRDVAQGSVCTFVV
jgi:hypothetical protein